MKCPVCKNEIPQSSTVCPQCSFSDLHKEFINVKDAQDWNRCVVLPYRAKWEAGIIGRPKWLEKEYECRAFHEECAQEKTTRINLRKSSDLQTEDPNRVLSLVIENYAGDIDCALAERISTFQHLKRFSVSTTYRGKICADSVNMIVRSCPEITELNFFSSISCTTLAQIDLTRIEKLFVSVDGSPVSVSLVSKRLHQLKLYGNEDGGTLLDNERVQVDFSGLPMLETLDIRRCPNIDYSSLAVLTKLKSLIIADAKLTNLSWLSRSYQLERLAVFGKVDSLAGLECQKCLLHLDLSYNALTNVAQIQELRDLRWLNLYGNSNVDCTIVRQYGVPKTILTRFDKDVQQIESLFTGKTYGSISGDAHAWIQNRDKQNLEAAPPYFRATLQRWKEKTFEEKAKDALQAVFEQKYQEICDNKSILFRGFDIRHRRTYIEMALQYYPFLRLSATMQADMERDNV